MSIEPGQMFLLLILLFVAIHALEHYNRLQQEMDAVQARKDKHQAKKEKMATKKTDTQNEPKEKTLLSFQKTRIEPTFSFQKPSSQPEEASSNGNVVKQAHQAPEAVDDAWDDYLEPSYFRRKAIRQSSGREVRDRSVDTSPVILAKQEPVSPQKDVKPSVSTDRYEEI